MLSLVKSLDYEVDHNHSITITVTDSVHVSCISIMALQL